MSNQSFKKICYNGHEYTSRLDKRNGKFSQCPICLNKKVLECFNDLASQATDQILSEWDYDKNTISPREIVYSSSISCWWICPEGHSYDLDPKSRTILNNGCPYCSSRRIVSGINDVVTKHPEILDSWDFDKNTLNPHTLPESSSLKAWFKCDKGHSYEQIISNKARLGCGCPYCANKRTLPGYNDLETLYPELMSIWDYEMNSVSPGEVSPKNHEKFWWKCDKCGDSYLGTAAHRIEGKRCPYCSGRVVRKGNNDLSSKSTTLAEEFDIDKNNILPDEVYFSSSKKFWWKCSKGHSWLQSPQARFNMGIGCPYCSGRIPIEGENDIATTHPSLLERWDYEKNSKLPTELSIGTDTKVWFRCSAGHSYKRVPAKELFQSCTYCMKHSESQFEYEILYYFSKLGYETEHRKRIKTDKKTLEADVFIKELNLVIEFDGYPWHKSSQEKDYKKRVHFESAGYSCFNIRDFRNSKLETDHQVFYIDQRSSEERSEAITQILNVLSIDHGIVDINTEILQIKEFREQYHK